VKDGQITSGLGLQRQKFHHKDTKNTKKRGKIREIMVFPATHGVAALAFVSFMALW
jgi:hypothetical protein